MDDSATQDLLQKTDALIAECGQLSRLLQQWKVKNEKNGEVDGLAKLTSMLNAENKFLDKVKTTATITIIITTAATSTITIARAMTKKKT